MHSDVRVHQAFELLRVVVALVPRDDQSSAIRETGRGQVSRLRSQEASNIFTVSHGLTLRQVR